MKPEFLVVGSGLTGATIARILTDAGCDVLVVERRSHLGGNVYDYVHPSGIRVHAYGSHCFRTNLDKVWCFVNRFASFYRYEATVKSYIDGKFENWPISVEYTFRITGKKHWKPAFKGTPSNFEEACLAKMPRAVYLKRVKCYTRRQWGVPPRMLSAELAERVTVRWDNDPRLKPNHRFQGLPEGGYSAFMEKMLSGIPVVLNCDYLKNKELFEPHMGLIFTGPIDEFFGYDFGRLAYRGQTRDLAYLPDTDNFQPCRSVTIPAHTDGQHIRTFEWKYLMPKRFASRIHGTVITREFPFSPVDSNQYEYPFPDKANERLYQRYRARADEIPSLLVCGRLGDYKYYDMDHATERAMELAEQLIEGGSK